LTRHLAKAVMAGRIRSARPDARLSFVIRQQG
jgi:hypothetical protein